MGLFRSAAGATDLSILVLMVLAGGQTGAPVPDLPLQVAVLGAGAAVTTGLLLVPRLCRGPSGPLLGAAKTLVLVLLFLVLPRGSTMLVPLWLTHTAVLTVCLGVVPALVLDLSFIAVLVFFLATFPGLLPTGPGELPGLALQAITGLAGAGVVFWARIQAQKLKDDEKRLAAYEKDLERLEAANVGFQEFSTLVEQHALRAERDRISREIHDSTGYSLTTLKMIFEAAKGVWQRQPDRIPDLMDQGITLCKDALDEVRAALRALRARRDPVVEGLSFVVRLIRNFEKVTNLRIEYDFSNTRQNYNPDVNALLYRMVQEGLTNAYRHGRASWVRLVLVEADDQLQVSLVDNGEIQGPMVKGIGLQGMEERIQSLGGTVAFIPRERGFEILASIPLVKEATHA